MKASLFTTAAMILIFVAEGAAHAQAKTKKCWLRCGTPTSKPYDLASANVSGDQLRGPATVRADNLNVLRYDYKFNLAISFSTVPDLWAKLQSLAAPAPSPAPEKPATGATHRPVITGPFKVNRKTQSTIGQAEALLKDSEGAMVAADAAIDAAAGIADVRDCLVSIPEAVDARKETKVQTDCLADLVTKSTTAVAQVKAGGQALVTRLPTKWNKPEVFIGYINDDLSATSTLTKATAAEWPDANVTATLKRLAQSWKTELASL
jgi:hypothetical protein